MDTRICTKCNLEKPATLDYFYHSPRTTLKLTSWCKDCMKKRSLARGYTPKNLKLPDIGESKAVNWLRSNGIAASGGKHVDTVTWLDVLAWGCVRIEVKYSKTDSRGIWSWLMYSVNNKPADELPHLILFIGDDIRTGESHYYLFDASHPSLFNDKTGNRKVNVTYNYMSANAVNHDIFSRHENALPLIEFYRLKVSRELINSVPDNEKRVES